MSASICLNYDYFIGNYHPRNIFCSYVLFDDLPRSIISISEVRHKWDEMERMLYLTYTPPRFIILSVIEGSWHGKEALMDDLV